LQEHELDANQLAVVSAKNYSNKAHTTTADLQRIVKSKYPFVEDNFDLILDIIWNATEYSNAFEATAE